MDWFESGVNAVAPVVAPVAASAAISAVATSPGSATDPVADPVDLAKDITTKLTPNPEKGPYELCKFVLTQGGPNISRMSNNTNGYALFSGLTEVINKHLFMNASKTNVYTTVCAVKDDGVVENDSKYYFTHRGFQLVQGFQTTSYGDNLLLNSSLYTQPSEQQQQINNEIQLVRKAALNTANLVRGFSRNLVKSTDMQQNEMYVFLTKEGKEEKYVVNATLEKKIYVPDSHYILLFKSTENITTTPVAINTSQMNGSQITFTQFILIMNVEQMLQKKSNNTYRSFIQTEGYGGKRRYKTKRNKRNKRNKRKQSKSKKQYKEKK